MLCSDSHSAMTHFRQTTIVGVSKISMSINSEDQRRLLMLLLERAAASPETGKEKTANRGLERNLALGMRAVFSRSS